MIWGRSLRGTPLRLTMALVLATSSTVLPPLAFGIYWIAAPLRQDDRFSDSLFGLSFGMALAYVVTAAALLAAKRWWHGALAMVLLCAALFLNTLLVGLGLFVLDGFPDMD